MGVQTQKHHYDFRRYSGIHQLVLRQNPARSHGHAVCPVYPVLHAVEFKVYKVHTIGDCYVVMGYNWNTESRDPSMECLRVLCMAYSMINVIQEVNATSV